MTQAVKPSRRQACCYASLKFTRGLHDPVHSGGEPLNTSQPLWRYPEVHIVGQDFIDSVWKMAKGLCEPPERVDPDRYLAARFQRRHQVIEAFPGTGSMMEYPDAIDKIECSRGKGQIEQ